MVEVFETSKEVDVSLNNVILGNAIAADFSIAKSGGKQPDRTEFP